MPYDKDKIDRLLNSNTPYYQAQGFEPADAGYPLLKKNQDKEEVTNQDTSNISVSSFKREDRVLIKGDLSSNSSNELSKSPLSRRQHNFVKHNNIDEALASKVSETESSEIINSNVNLPVHVGNHEEHRWYDVNVTGSSDKIIDNDQYVNTDDLQGINPLEDIPRKKPEDLDAEMTREANTLFDELHHDSDEVSVNKQEPVNMDKESYVKELPIIDNLLSIEDDSYCIFVDKNLILSSKDKENVERIVEDIMLNHSVDKGRITILKKVSLNFGITIK